MEGHGCSWKVFRDSQPWSEVVLVFIHQSTRIAQFAADENGGNAIIEDQVRVGVLLVIEGTGGFVAEADVDSRRGRHLPTVLRERRRTPGAQIPFRDARPALLFRRGALPHVPSSR